MQLAVVGAGRWGQNYLRILENMPDCQVKWCSDWNPYQLKLLQAVYPKVSFTTGLTEILTDPDVQAVIIATPPLTHFAIALACLEYGKHVLVEKPCVRKASEVYFLRDLAARRHKVFMVGHIMEYHPALEWLKNYLGSGNLGNLLYLRLTRASPGIIRQDVNVLWDLAVHDLSILRFLLEADPVSVAAQGACCIRPDIHDVIFVTLKFPKSVMAQIHATWLAPRKIREVTIVGDREMAVFDDVKNLGKIRIYDTAVNGLYEPGRVRTSHVSVYVPALPTVEPLVKQCQHFLDCIRQGKEPCTGWQDAEWVTRIAELAEQCLGDQNIAWAEKHLIDRCC